MKRDGSDAPIKPCTGSTHPHPSGRRHGGTPSHPGPRHRPGRRLPSVRLQPRRASRTGRLRQESDRDRPHRGGRRAGRPGTFPRRTGRPAAAARTRSNICPGNGGRRLANSNFASTPARPTPAGVVFISPDVAVCARLPRGIVRPGRPSVRLSLPELHQLRAAADDHHRRPLRPPAHDDGRLSDVRRLPGGIRRPDEPPLPRPADGLRRLRAASGAARRRTASRSPPPTRSPFSPPPCSTARSGRSRASAVITWPATPATPAAVAELRAAEAS